MKVLMDEIPNVETKIESLKADHQKEKHPQREEIRVTADALVLSQAVLGKSHSSFLESQTAILESQAALAEIQVENDVLKRGEE
jgi:hypothetical protein